MPAEIHVKCQNMTCNKHDGTQFRIINMLHLLCKFTELYTPVSTHYTCNNQTSGMNHVCFCTLPHMMNMLIIEEFTNNNVTNTRNM